MAVINRALAPFGETIFTEISRLANQHKAVNLGQGFPNFDGPAFVKDAAIAAINAGQSQYARMFGLPELNRAIADRFACQSGVAADPETQVTVTSGCTEAIASTMLGLLNPGDEVILFEPYYDSYRACVAMAGATARFVTLRPPDFAFDQATLEGAVTRRTRAVLVNTPHNPTGKVFSRTELERIAKLCIKHDLIALSDEVYERLVYEGEHVSIGSLPGMADRTVTLSSLGKSFSLTGWKIGWAIASAELTRSIRAAHQFITFATATPLQHGAIAAMRAPESYDLELRREYGRRRTLLVDGLREVGFTIFPPAGTYFVLVDHTPFGFADDVQFCKHLIENVGVAAIPTSVFYHQPQDGQRLVRFAFCKTDDVLQSGLERMRARLHRP
jgi:aspartate/methionine/tyrosine aminotransferase